MRKTTLFLLLVLITVAYAQPLPPPPLPGGGELPDGAELPPPAPESPDMGAPSSPDITDEFSIPSFPDSPDGEFPTSPDFPDTEFGTPDAPGFPESEFGIPEGPGFPEESLEFPGDTPGFPEFSEDVGFPGDTGSLDGGSSGGSSGGGGGSSGGRRSSGGGGGGSSSIGSGGTSGGIAPPSVSLPTSFDEPSFDLPPAPLEGETLFGVELPPAPDLNQEPKTTKLWIILAVLASTLIMGGIYYYVQRSKDVPPQTKAAIDYVKQMIAQGFPREAVKQRMLTSGYKPEDINSIFSRVK